MAKSKTTSVSKGIHSAICPKIRKALLRDKPFDVYSAEFDKTKAHTSNKKLLQKWLIEEKIDMLANAYFKSGKHQWASCVQAVKTNQAPNSNANYFVEIDEKQVKRLPIINSKRTKIKLKDVEKFAHLVVVNEPKDKVKSKAA